MLSPLFFNVFRLESFAESCRVPNLIGCFADDKDLIEILLISELPYFMDNIVQLKQHYPRMDLKRLLALMEKVSSRNNFETVERNSILKFSSCITLVVGHSMQYNLHNIVLCSIFLHCIVIMILVGAIGG